MATIFISYANESMSYSLRRIGRQARKLGIFDKVILYSPKDLPDYVQNNPLMQYGRGGGYWCWKPALILETLQKSGENDIIVYADAGCSLRPSSQWMMFIRLMQRYDTLCFQYDSVMPSWKKWGSIYSATKFWTKKETLDFLDSYLGSTQYHDFNQIWGGCLFIKNKNNPLLHHWLSIIQEHPEIIKDPTSLELKQQYPDFAAHRHDQSILTALAFFDKKTMILPEVSEQYSKDAFVWASRFRAANYSQFLKVRSKQYLRHILGDHVFESIKKLRRNH